MDEMDIQIWDHEVSLVKVGIVIVFFCERGKRLLFFQKRLSVAVCCAKHRDCCSKKKRRKKKKWGSGRRRRKKKKRTTTNGFLTARRCGQVRTSTGNAGTLFDEVQDQPSIPDALVLRPRYSTPVSSIFNFFKNFVLHDPGICWYSLFSVWTEVLIIKKNRLEHPISMLGG